MSDKNWESSVVAAMLAKLVTDYERSAVEFLLIAAVGKCYHIVQKYKNLWESFPQGLRVNCLSSLYKLLLEAVIDGNSESILRPLLRFLESPVLQRSDLFWLICYPYRSDLDPVNLVHDVIGDRNIFRNNLLYITKFVGELVDESEKQVPSLHKMSPSELDLFKKKFVDLERVLKNHVVPVAWAITKDLSAE